MENRLGILHLEDQENDSVIVKHIINKDFALFDYYIVVGEQEFREVLEAKKIDVILSDYEIPGFSGMAALEIVKTQYPDIPFIFVTGKMGEDAAIDSLLKGATDYVLKSKIERLVPAIKRVLNVAELLKKKNAVDKALFDSEEKYRKLVENISDVIFEVNEAGIITYISPVVFKILGYKPEEVIGKHFINFIFEADAQFITERFRELYSNLENNYEYRFLTKTGEICWVRVSTKAIIKENQFKGGSGTLIDINKRMKAEEELLKEQYLMEALMENIPDHIYFKDLESRFIRISKSKIASFQLNDTKDAIGKTDFDFFTEEHARAAFLDEQEIIRTGQTMIKEERETWADRADTWALSAKMPLRNMEGEIIGTFGISRDVTERKQFEGELLKAKEKAEAGDRLKTAFIRNISHEIRTPLNGILGFGQLITDPDLSKEEREEYLTMLNSSIDRLINAVTNIMDISLIVSGNQEVRKATVTLGKLLEEFYEKFYVRCILKKLEFSIEKQEGVDNLRIFTDPELLKRVLNYLTENAIKFTEKGSIVVGCKILKDKLKISVKDTGIGITPEEQNKIFDHFMQKDISFTRDFEGSGLGLSIAKGLVEMLGGSIWVESVKGEGSVFSFELPISGAL